MPTPADFDRLYDEHSQALFAFFLSFTRNEADTRDLLQEVFIKLARRPGLLKGVREPRAFLLRLAHNLAIDLFRRRGAEEKYYSEFGAQPVPLFAETSELDERVFRERL